MQNNTAKSPFYRNDPRSFSAVSGRFRSPTVRRPPEEALSFRLEAAGGSSRERYLEPLYMTFHTRPALSSVMYNAPS
jgi:hypothetical protein